MRVLMIAISIAALSTSVYATNGFSEQIVASSKDKISSVTCLQGSNTKRTLASTRYALYVTRVSNNSKFNYEVFEVRPGQKDRILTTCDQISVEYRNYWVYI